MSSSSDSEVFEFAPAKVRPTRVPPSPAVAAGVATESGSSKPLSRSPEMEAEERYEALESVGEALEELRRAFDALSAQTTVLESEAKGDVPAWVRTLGEQSALLCVAPVLEALEAVGDELRREKDRLCGRAGSEGSERASKAVRHYLSALRSFHTKNAKKLDAALRGMSGVVLGDSFSVIGGPPSAAGSGTVASLSTSPSATPVTATVAPVAEAPVAVAPVAPVPVSPNANSVAANTAAAAGRPPPPLPLRRGMTMEDDPFAEQPNTPVDPNVIRSRAKSSAPSVLVKVGSGGVPPLFATPPPGSVSPRGEPTTPPGNTAPGSTPPAGVSPLAAAAAGGSAKSPRGRGGRRGVEMGQRRLAQSTGDNGEREKTLLPLEFGSAERPLKPLTRAGDLELIPESSAKFEVHRKGGLLTSSSYTLTVAGGTESSISIYDVKQQHTVARPLAEVLKVTRSNKNPRKLKIHWRNGDSCDRFLFASDQQREQFVECVWSFRSPVPNPFLYAEPIEIFVGTWNLGDAMPAPNVDAWLHPHEYDIYCVSAQEAGYDLEKGQSGSAEAHFFALIASSLGPEYQLVAQLSLLHIRLCVFVAKKHSHKISNVRKASVATGIGNVIGNKGGCFVSLSFNETSLCFIGCHLAAREERYEQRCTNVQQILQGINAEQPAGLGPDTWFDYVFWTGDLNYRLTADREEVCRWAKEGKVELLLQSDQLLQAKRECKAFYQWTEPPIHFSPSYRFDRGSSDFSEEKMRTPSYCDRVLYKSKPGLPVTVREYDCVHSLTTSDHHPVWAALLVDTRLPSPATSRGLSCYLELTELTGKDMAFVTAERDPPFLVFYSSITKSKSSKRSVIRGPTPKWQDAGVPRLKCLVAARPVLALAHVAIAVRDGKNEVGQCVLSLADACGPQPAEFVATVVNGGLPAGELRGKMHFKWGAAAAGGVGEESEIGGVEESYIQGPATGNNAGGLLGASGGAGEGVLKSGFLLKQGSKVKSWKRRWFVFSANGELAYFADRKAPRPLDRLQVEGVSAAPNAGKLNCIAIRTTGKRVLLFCADNTADYDGWMQVLNAFCDSKK